MRTLWRWTKRLTVVALVLGLVGVVAGWFAYQKWVVREPGEQMDRAAILAIISQESPVLYADGTTRVGVFFSQEHRAYVRYDDIPRDWVDAIVAAEDKNFWSHPGIDVEGITRAMARNVQAGEVVAGGSTLTQQTAKNLFYRPDRSLGSKWRELVNALRLEAHYSKKDILEFYANQFHVSANGRGLGIAARYFFDKDPKDLDTLECAFLAGMVKAPASYNPFVGVSEERRALARQRAKDRTHYVLERMRVMGSLSESEYASLAGKDIPFRQGRFRYDTSIILDEVAERLDEAPFPALFEDLGIDNPSTAGIRIVTTIDANLQREATWALWHHLSSIGPLLEGQTVDALKVAAPTKAPDEDEVLGVHGFAVAKVMSTDKGGLTLAVPGGTCSVDKAALQRIGDILAKAAKGESSRTAKKADVEALVVALPIGTYVWASLREKGMCDLELRPALQGAALVLEDGQIRAMVGGNDNRNFNRAIDAKRQLGSTWKPIIYDSAIQLGWTPVDVLDNRKNAFYFEGTWYYPRPDHESTDFVSMSWAATRSENLASVWLLAHLTDRLTPDQLKDVATRVGLGPVEGEPHKDWITRIRDDAGVISTPGRMDEIAFYGVKTELVDEVPQEERIELRSLLYGRGAATERVKVKKDKDRVQALGATYLALAERVEPCKKTLADFKAALATPLVTPPTDLHLLSRGGRLVFVCGRAPKEALTLDAPFLQGLQQGLQLPVDLDDPTSMVVDGRLSVGTLESIDRSMKRRSLVLAGSDPYDWEVISLHPDFRLLVGMRYVALLAKQLGVDEIIPPVLSMPLGAVDIRLEEAALLYQGMLNGDRWTFPGTETAPSSVPGLRSSRPVEGPESPTLLIAEIRDRDGNLLYRARPVPEPVIDAAAGRQVGDMLRNVVKWGTGRRALDAVTLGDSVVPVAGKTGTTNGYKNVAFSGFVPRATGEGYRWGDGFTVTAYVGYDDNRPMRRGAARIQGASGALPVWIGVAQGLSSTGLLGTAPPSVPAPEPPSEELAPEGAVPVPAPAPDFVVGSEFTLLALDAATGLVSEEGTEGPRALVAQGREQAAERRFMPVSTETAVAPASAAMAPGKVEVAPEPTDEEDAALKEIWLEEMDAPADPRLQPVEVPDEIPMDGEGPAAGPEAEPNPEQSAAPPSEVAAPEGEP